MNSLVIPPPSIPTSSIPYSLMNLTWNKALIFLNSNWSNASYSSFFLRTSTTLFGSTCKSPLAFSMYNRPGFLFYPLLSSSIALYRRRTLFSKVRMKGIRSRTWWRTYDYCNYWVSNILFASLISQKLGGVNFNLSSLIYNSISS